MKIFWLLAGNIIYAAAQWLILWIFTRSYTKVEVGEYFFALSLAAPIFLFFAFKIPNLIVTSTNGELEKKDIAFFKLISSVVSIVIIFLIYLLFFSSNSSLVTLSAVVIYKILEQYDDVINAYYQADLKFKSIFLIKLFRSFVYVGLTFACSILFDNLQQTILYSTLFYSIFWLIRSWKYDLFSFQGYKNLAIKYIFDNGLYLSLSSSLASLSTSGTRIYIGYALGSSVLAVYGVISYSLIVLNIIVSALGQYFLPNFVKYRDNLPIFLKQVYQSQLIILLIMMPCSLISYFYGNQILEIIYGVNYQDYGYYLFLVFISGLFKSSSALLGTMVTALKYFKFQYKFTLINLFLTFTLIPLLVFKIGFKGIFYALIFISIIEWFLYIFFIKKVMKSATLY